VKISALIGRLEKTDALREQLKGFDDMETGIVLGACVARLQELGYSRWKLVRMFWMLSGFIARAKKLDQASKGRQPLPASEEWRR